jgi:hypothetical protein
MRTLVIVLALFAAGCGDDTTGGASTDLAQPVLDLSRHAVMCGVSICTNDCSACIPLGGGVCVPPCMTANPDSCTAPAMCHPLGADPDAGGSATLVGSCTGLGYDGYCG